MINKLRNGHWPIFLLTSLSSLGNMFLPIILVRFLTPDDVGVYKIFFLHLSVIPFLFMAGGPMHSVYYWAGRKEEDRKKFFNATWVLTLILSLLVLIIGLPLKNFIVGHLDIPAQYFVILILIGAMTCPSGHFIESSMALGKNIGAVLDTVFELIKAAGFIFIAWKYANLYYLIIYFLFFMFIKTIVTVVLNYRMNKVGLETNKDHLQKVILYCAPISTSGLLAFFIDKLDLLLLSTQLDASSYAYYSLGCLVVPPLYLLEMAVQKKLIPSLSKSYLEGDANTSAASFRLAIKDISFLIIPSIFGLVIFGTPIVKLLYTEQYLESVIFLKIFAFSYLLLMFPHDSVARASGKTSWILRMYLITTPILLVAAYFTAKLYGAVGVLSVTILIKFIPKFLGLRFSKKTMNWNWSEMFPTKHLILFTGICILLSGASLALHNKFENDLWWFYVCGPLFGIIYLAVANLVGAKGRYAKP